MATEQGLPVITVWECPQCRSSNLVRVDLHGIAGTAGEVFCVACQSMRGPHRFFYRPKVERSPD